jgi:hypothetical protein
MVSVQENHMNLLALLHKMPLVLVAHNVLGNMDHVAQRENVVTVSLMVLKHAMMVV